MAKQKLNKTLIGGLTVVAAIVAVLSVAIVTMQQAKKDPTELAAKAKAAEDSREFNRASDLYRRAFTVNKEGKYLVDAARVTYAAGELTGAIQLLNLAASQDPRNVAVLTAILERYWELVDGGLTSVADSMETHADNLLAVEPDNVLGLASRAFALGQARDAKPTNAKDAADALDKALKLDPKNPRLAQLSVDRMLREAADQAKPLLDKGRTDEAEALAKRVQENAINLLKESIASKAQTRSYQYLSRLLASMSRLDEARQAMEEGIKALPQETDLRIDLARVLYTQASKAGEDKAKAQALLTEAVKQLNEAIKAEPAYYTAYTIRAEVQEQLWRATGEWDKDVVAKQKELLDGLISALRDTVTMKGIKAELGKFGARQELLVAAFDRATSFQEQVTDPASKASAIEYAKRFYDEARTSYSDAPFVFIMEGQIAIMNRDTRAAIQAYTKAATLANNSPQYQRMAKERLALLHREAGESGLSLSMTEEALALYPANQSPRALILNRAQLLTLLNRPKDALDYIDRLPEVLRSAPEFIKVKGESYAALGQTELAQQEFAKLGSDLGALLGQVRTAATAGDWGAAEAAARKALDSAPTNPDALRALYIVLLQEKKSDDAKQVIADLKARPDNSEEYKRVLSVYELLLSEPDADKRDQKLLELVSLITDPVQRASERANFFVMRGKFAEASAEADTLEKLKPDDERIWRMQFDLALRVKKWDRAESYLTKLAAKNADHAQGSLLRANLKLARGDSDSALRDLRAAEQLLPTDSDVKVQIAKALLTVKPARYADAVDSLTEAADIDPLNFEAQKLLYLCLNDALGRPADALPHLRQAARLNPADELIVKRSRILEEEDDPAKGLAWREPLRQTDPKNVENLSRLAYLYDRLQQNDKAVEAIQAAAALDPANKSIAVLASNIFSRLKQRGAGEALLKSFEAAVTGLDKISANVLHARFLESQGDSAAAQALLTDTEKRAAEIAGGDANQQTRARLLASAELAEFFGRQDLVAPMIDTYRRALTSAKDFPDDAARIRLRIAKALLVDRQYDASEKEIASYQKDFPQDPRGWLAESELCIARNQFDRAVELLTKVLNVQPKHQWALFTRARVNMERRQYALATEDLIKLKSLAPSNSQARMELARLYEITARYPEAENELRELFAQNPDNRMVAARLINVLKEGGKFALAQRFASEQAARRADDPFWPYQLASLYNERQDFANAITQYKKTVELTKSRDPLALEKLMRTLMRADRVKEVPALFEGLKPEVVTPTLAAVAGDAYARLKQKDKASAEFDKAVRAASTQPSGELSAVARQSATSWSYADTIALLRKVVAETKDVEASQRLRVVLGRMLIESGDKALATEGTALVDALLKESQPGTVTHVEAMLAKATAAESTRDWEGAVKQYEEILKQAPDLPAALNNLSFILADELKRAAEALPYAERARQLAPDNPDFSDTLGWVYLKLGKLDAAEAALLDARRLAPDSLAIRYHIAQLYSQRGDKSAARRELETLGEMARAAQDSEYIRKTEEAIGQLK